MNRAGSRCLSVLVVSAILLQLLSPNAAAQSAPAQTGLAQSKSGNPGAQVAPPFTCSVYGPDRICGGIGSSYIYSATITPPAGGLTHSWSLFNTTTGGCIGTGTATPTFCGPTNQPTVCINPGTASGRFVLQVVVTDGVNTSTCCLSINTGPSTTSSRPPSASTCPGQTATFCTTAGGPGPFTYSWAKNGATISGATNSCYTATAGPAGTVDHYCVTTTGTGPCGLPFSTCTFLTSLGGTATTALTPASVCEGATNQFCTTASGPGPFTYAWTRNGTSIPGATNNCFTATAGAGGTVDTYCVSVTGPCGPPAQRCATLTSNANTTASALTPASACEGTTSQFCTTAGGTGPFTYAWTRNGSSIPGATSSCFTATAGAGGAVDTYCVTVTGTCGPPVQRCATLTSNPNTTATALSPAAACEGTTSQFCTTAGGTGPFTYAWTQNGSSIAGATSSCFTATARAGGGTVDTYCVTVTGACGPPVQRCTTLTSNANATASALTPATVCEGATSQFCTTAGGTGPFTYAWTRNGSSIPGATSSCFTATAGAGGAVDTYCVTVTGTCGPPVQRCATLTATSNVTASALTPANACEGTTSQFCTTAGGTGPFTYAWTQNGSSIPGATSSCFTATAGTGGTVDTYCVTVTGACGPPVQRCATLTSNSNTTASALSPAAVCEGTTSQFCTTAGGTGPFTYAWTQNGSTIAGATSSCFTATARAGGGTVDTYCVTVTGACGPPVQRCGTLTSNANTTATTLSPATVCEGTTSQFCTTAGGTGPFTYAWTQNGSSIPGATDSCFTATAGTGGSVDTYCVTVTGTCGPPVQRCSTLTSNANTTATALSPATVCEGLTSQFCTTAGGTGPFTYAWTQNGSSIPGATDSCFTATAGAGGSVDTYCVTVTGTCGPPVQRCSTLTATTNATATALTPAIVCEGLTNQFCTTAGGTGPFAYAWTQNGSSIPGATDSCFTATAGTGGTVDTYCVTVTGACGPPVQRCATLTANANTTATALSPATVCEGTTSQFCTTAGGTGPFTYAWTMNGSTVGGATSSCFTATAGTGGTVDTYCVTVTGTCGPPVQRCATLTANSNVTATIPSNGLRCTGETFQFCTTAGGTGPFTYSWTKNGSTIAGATNSCFTATAGAPMALDTYCVTVTGACGSVTQCALLRALANTSASPMANAFICPGTVHQFCTTVGGVAPFTFSWTRNGVTIPGASNACYTASASTPMALDTYCVTVTGACGPPVTQCALLRTLSNTSATPLSNASVCFGATHQFCTSVGGVAPFTFTWTRNGVTIPGATMACYTATARALETEVYCVSVTGLCGPPVARCATLTRLNCAGSFGTLDQLLLGNPFGQFNGISMPTLVQTLLQGDLPVGRMGMNSLTLQPTPDCANCVIDLLPMDGTMGALPAFGDETFEPNQCQTWPIPIPIVNGEFESLLIGQVVTLSLNVKLNEGGVTGTGGCTTTSSDLAAMGLCQTMVSRTLLPGSDGCIGTADDEPDLLGADGNPSTPDNLVTVTIPEAVIISLNELTALGEMTKGQTVGGLVELSNLAVAGGNTWTATPEEISAALDAVNILYLGGRETMDCTNP